MGNFFTSSQIYNNENLNKQQFIDKFCKAMADSGYVVCDSDEGEKSYILRFDADSKWVAIASEEYAPTVSSHTYALSQSPIHIETIVLLHPFYRSFIPWINGCIDMIVEEASFFILT